MAEFLVEIHVCWPESVSEARRVELRAAELSRAKELHAQGIFIRMWRIVGNPANWGLWHAKDATELHQALASLPIWPYMKVSVMAMARHPVDPLSWPENAEKLPQAANGFKS